jgi:hypothetical protein
VSQTNSDKLLYLQAGTRHPSLADTTEMQRQLRGLARVLAYIAPAHPMLYVYPLSSGSQYVEFVPDGGALITPAFMKKCIAHLLRWGGSDARLLLL